MAAKGREAMDDDVVHLRLDQLLAAVERLTKSFDTLTEPMAQYKLLIPQLSDAIKALEDKIGGNGKLGMEMRIDRQEAIVGVLDDDVAALRLEWKERKGTEVEAWKAYTVGSGAFVGFLAGVYEVVQFIQAMTGG